MGLTHIYCGSGKGKTTAALGLAVRAFGAGMRVLIVQLMKGSDTSELKALKALSGVRIERLEKDPGFSFTMDDDTRAETMRYHNYLLENAYNDMESGSIDMLVIDEFFSAYELELVDRKLADNIVFGKPENCELVLTGRDPDDKFITAADYVSEIREIKHPYRNGITARRGIEY